LFDEAPNALAPMPVVDARRNPLDLAYLNEVNLRSTKMDTLDIQSRAVVYAIAKYPKLAGHFFDSIDLSVPHNIPCEELSIANPAPYYWAAQSIIAAGRTVSSALGENPATALIQLSQSIKAPSELPPMLDLVTGIKLSPADLQLVIANVSEVFDRLTATDREMAAIQEQWHLFDKVALLSSLLKAASISSTSLLNSYRAFLSRSLRGRSCDDHIIDRHHIKEAFNELAARLNSDGNNQIEQLRDQDLMPQFHASAVPVPSVPSLKPIMPEVRRIMSVKQANIQQEYRLGSPGTLQPETSDMEAILDFISSSTLSQSRCSICNYESKVTVVVMLLSSLPQGDAMKQTIDIAFNELLTSNSLENDNPSEWVKLIKDFRNISRKPDDKAKALIDKAIKSGSMPVLLPNPEAETIHRHFRESRDPIIAAYWLAEELMDPSFHIG